MTGFEIFMMVASMASSMMQAQQQRKAQQRAAQQAADQAAKEKWEQYEAQEKQRKDQLKKALAKKRAQMGASGLSGADGSAGAIIQGLRTDKAEATFDDYAGAQEEVENKISTIHSNLLSKSENRNRTLYNQVGSTLGALGGSLIGQEQDGQKLGSLASGFMD